MRHCFHAEYCLGLFAAVAFVAHAQTTSDIRPELSLVPPYPADGLFRTDIQDQYVFVKAPGEYVVSYSSSLDPASRPGRNGRIEFPITFPSQVSPVIDVRIEAFSNGEYLYSYSIGNLSDAKAALASILLRTRSIEAVEGLASPTNPPGWILALLRNPEDHLGPAWNAASPLQRGGAAVQFSFRSTAKPGIAEMTFRGSPSVSAEINRVPGLVKAQILKLERGFLGSVRLVTVGPIYPPDVHPFAVAADLFGQTGMFPDDRKNTAYIKEVRSQLKQYLDDVGSAVQLLEHIRVKPDLRISARPLSYEDAILQKVVAETLKVK
jgi:hypothetical protein